MNEDVLLWLAVAVVTAIIEGATASMVSVWFTAGAVAAMLVGLISDAFLLQIGVFIVVSGASLALFREKCMKNRKKTVPTNADRVIGKTAKVIERIDNRNETGAVTVDGQVWTARSDKDELVFEKDSMVKVISLSGVKVIVTDIL